jgi:integrative and conjugative element protein (TIGR02256 family)
MVVFRSEELDLELSFSDNVIHELQKYRQTGAKLETGGMLFTSSLDSNVIDIDLISSASDLDVRKRFGFIPNKRTAQTMIDKNYKNGFYYIGDWHTHPELSPSPSPQDLKTIKSLFRKSKHDLTFFVILILCQSNSFKNSYVALADGRIVHKCKVKTLL